VDWRHSGANRSVLENLKRPSWPQSAAICKGGQDHGLSPKNMGDFAAMKRDYATYLAKDGWVAPARSTVEVARLPKDALVEIEVIALR